MLLEKIEEDFRSAMKERDVNRVSTLRLLRSAIHNATIAARTSAKQALDESEVEAVVKQEAKRLKDALVDFTKAARQDLVDSAKAELAILSAYLPQGFTPAELKALVKKIVARLKAEGVNEFGQVMKEVMKEIKGRADGQEVAQAVREELN